MSFGTDNLLREGALEATMFNIKLTASIRTSKCPYGTIDRNEGADDAELEDDGTEFEGSFDAVALTLTFEDLPVSVSGLIFER